MTVVFQDRLAGVIFMPMCIPVNFFFNISIALDNCQTLKQFKQTCDSKFNYNGDIVRMNYFYLQFYYWFLEVVFLQNEVE